MVGNLGFEPRDNWFWVSRVYRSANRPYRISRLRRQRHLLSFRFSFRDKTGNTNANIPKVWLSQITSNSLFWFMGTNSKAAYLVHSYGIRTHIGLLLKPSWPIRRTNDKVRMGTHPYRLSLNRYFTLRRTSCLQVTRGDHTGAFPPQPGPLVTRKSQRILHWLPLLGSNQRHSD